MKNESKKIREEVITQFLHKMGVKGKFEEGGDLSGYGLDDLREMVVANQTGCFATGDMSGAVVDVEPLEDSMFESNMFGVYYSKHPHQIFRLFAKQRVVHLDKSKEDMPEELRDKNVAMLAVEEVFVRGIPLFYQPDDLREVLKGLDISDIIMLYAMQDRLAKAPEDDEMIYPDRTKLEGMITEICSSNPASITVGSVFPVAEENGRAVPAVDIYEDEKGDFRYVTARHIKTQLLFQDIPTIPYSVACNLEPMPLEALWEILYNGSMMEVTGVSMIQQEALSGRFQKADREGRR